MIHALVVVVKNTKNVVLICIRSCEECAVDLQLYLLSLDRHICTATQKLNFGDKSMKAYTYSEDCQKLSDTALPHGTDQPPPSLFHRKLLSPH